MSDAHLILCAAKWKKRWQDSNPEVGMGPSLGSVVDSILEETGANLTRESRGWVLAELKKLFPRE